MKRLALFVFASMALSSLAMAQEKARSVPSLRREPAEAATPTQTPEMWLYEQERSRWENPEEAVRRKAEFRASQRANRVASMKWYGMSNSRPAANATPLMSTYSPTWTSNGYDPYRWSTARDTSTTTVIVR